MEAQTIKSERSIEIERRLAEFITSINPALIEAVEESTDEQYSEKIAS